MSGGDKYPSVFERITWATGFRLAIDKHVLGALSAFANFRTGKGACPTVDALAARAKVPRSTLLRSMARLNADGWIQATRRHRRPTSYDIVVDKLPMHWLEAKLVKGLSPTGETQDPVLSPTGGTQLTTSLSLTNGQVSPTGETQDAVLGPAGETQTEILSPTGETPSPVRTEIPSTEEIPRVDPQSAPARRAGSFPLLRAATPTLFPIAKAKVEGRNGTDGTTAPRDADVPTDDRDRARRDSADGGFWGAARAHQTAASRAGVSVPQRSDSPSAASADRSRARVGAQQKTFGPLDVTSGPRPGQSQWARLAEIGRAVLKDLEAREHTRKKSG